MPFPARIHNVIDVSVPRLTDDFFQHDPLVFPPSDVVAKPFFFQQDLQTHFQQIAKFVFPRRNVIPSLASKEESRDKWLRLIADPGEAAVTG